VRSSARIVVLAEGGGMGGRGEMGRGGEEGRGGGREGRTEHYGDVDEEES